MAIGLTIKHSTGEITTGTGNLTLNAAGNLVLDYATFPASDGTAGFVLSTDGAGNLSWIADDDTPAGYNNTNWDTAYGYGNHASAGYLTSQTTHADVVQDGDFTSQGIMLRGGSAGSYSILADASSNWNTAYTHSQAAHAPSGAQVNESSFKTLAVSGQSNVVADTATDTLTLVAGSNMTITTTAGTDTVTFASSGGGVPGGANTQVQYNNSGAFGGDAGLTYNAGTDTLTAGVYATTGASPTITADNDMTISTSANNGDITLTPHNTGDIVLDGQKWPQADGTNNQVLKTNGSGQLSWVAQSGGGSTTLSALTDTTITTPATNSMLQYNGSAWIDAVPTTAHVTEGANLYYTNARADARIAAASIGALTDVNTTGAANGNILQFNGSTWVDATPSTSNISEGSNLYYTDARADPRVAAGSINNLVEDTTPQLGGTLDANSNTIDMGVNIITDAKVGNYDTAVATMPNWNLAYTHSQAAHAPSGAEVNQNAFTTVAVSGQTNVVADAKTDTLTFVAGSNVTLTTNAGADSVTIAASGGGGSQNVFSTIAVSGQSNVVADATTDTLTLVAGSNVTLTTNAGADSVTIAASGGGGSSSETFTVNYAAGGSTISSVSNLPSGWSSSIAGNNVTITHTASGQPMGISFYGLDKSASPDVWKYGYPTSTYPVTFPDTGAGEVISTTEFTLTIGTAATGANTGTPFATSLAHVKVIF